MQPLFDFLALDQFARDCFHVLGAQTELLEKRGGRAGMAELVIDADAAQLRRALFAEHSRDCLSKAADDVVLFAGDDLAALLGCLQDDLLVEGLNGADVDDAGVDAFFGEVLRQLSGLRRP